jgi:hypothetical protein
MHEALLHTAGREGGRTAAYDGTKTRLPDGASTLTMCSVFNYAVSEFDYIGNTANNKFAKNVEGSGHRPI